MVHEFAACFSQTLVALEVNLLLLVTKLALGCVKSGIPCQAARRIRGGS